MLEGHSGRSRDHKNTGPLISACISHQLSVRSLSLRFGQLEGVFRAKMIKFGKIQTMFKALASLFLLCCTSFAYPACALSPESHPRGVVGLQLFYPDDPQSWGWANDLNVSWLRIELRWDWIEPYQGQFDASYIDRVMALASTHPQKILVLFNHVPKWAERDVDLLPARAAAALTWLVNRYGARVLAWEIFNEPNLPGYGWPDVGRSVQDSATVYARTLSEAASTIRDVDKKALVISAGLSPQNDPDLYARWLVRLTPPDCYDALGLHPYGQKGRFAAVQHNATTLLEQEKRPPKPVWFTEYGTDQNSDRSKLLLSLAEEKSSSSITFFFTERDIGWFTGQYGLRHKDGTAKDDYNTFKQINLR